MQNSPTVVIPNNGSLPALGQDGGFQSFGIPIVASFGSRFAALGFQGSGILNDSLVTDIADATLALSDASTMDGLKSLLRTSAGAFTVQVLDRQTRDILFLNDPLGGGIIFHFQTAKLESISIDLSSLRMALNSFGTRLERDPFYELSRFATGTACYAADTPFVGVRVLPPGSGLQITPEGGVKFLDYGVAAEMEELSDLDHGALVEVGSKRITANVTAILESDRGEIYADITGGFDSRLMLASLEAAHAQRGITLTSLRNNCEWEYAEKLAAICGFQLTDQRFLSGGPRKPASLFESSVSGARGSGGIIENGLDPLTPPAPIITLQGGYGETFRAFNRSHIESSENLDPVSFGSSLWSWSRIMKTKINGEMLLTNDLLETLSDRVFRFIRPLISDGIPANYLTNELYLRSRNRYWVGQQSYWRSQIQTRIDPLYNIPLIVAAKKLDFWKRRANFVGLDALRYLDPKLLEYPFFNKGVISNSYEDQRGVVTKRNFPPGSVHYREVNFNNSTPIARIGPSEQLSDEDLAISRSIGVPAVQVAGIRNWGPSAVEAILSNPELRVCFSEKALNSLLLEPPLNGAQYQIAGKLIGCLFRSGVIFPDSASQFDKFLFTE